MSENRIEQSLVLIKPDALKNSLTGYVLSQLSEFHTGLRFAGMKVVHVSRMLAEEHYEEHRTRNFFPALIDYIRGFDHFKDHPDRQRVIAIVYQGEGAVQKIRDIAGPTNPLHARLTNPGCIRALGTLVPLEDANGMKIGKRMDNLIHASASKSEAEKEIKLWFLPCDIPPLMRAYPTEINPADHYYFKNGELYKSHKPGSVCLVAPGDMVWKSDLDALGTISKKQKAICSLDTIAAKYLIC